MIQAELSTRDKIATGISNTKNVEDKEFKAKEEATVSEQKKEALRLSMERDRIERERSHVKLDLELVEKAKAQLQEKIHQEGKEFVLQRNQALEKREKVKVTDVFLFFLFLPCFVLSSLFPTAAIATNKRQRSKSSFHSSQFFEGRMKSATRACW